MKETKELAEVVGFLLKSGCIQKKFRKSSFKRGLRLVAKPVLLVILSGSCEKNKRGLSFKLQRQLDTYFLLAHMCSVKLKEWTLVLLTLLRSSKVFFDLFRHDVWL
nr:uncharacterized protein LOC112766524 [Arachis hypogaea]